MKKYKIAVIPGDGIGPEIIAGAVRVLDEVASRFGFEVDHQDYLAGGSAIDATGHPLPQETIDACLASDAVLLGAVGGPKWDQVPSDRRPERALLGLRKAMGLYANLRPARMFPALAAASPLHPDIVKDGIDILFVRELIGGIYFGDRGRDGEGCEQSAFDTERYSVMEVERIGRMAFEAARGRDCRLTSVDKANVLESSRLWRETMDSLAKDYPDVALDHLYVDNAAMQLVRRPSTLDVVVTTNMFGDILSDEAAIITGSIGLLPSASLGDPGKPGMYEPIHGSAPDIAGQDICNPLATILSLAMLLRYSLGEDKAADAVEEAVDRVLKAGYRSRDLLLAGEKVEAEKVLGCKAMTEKVLEILASL